MFTRKKIPHLFLFVSFLFMGLCASFINAKNAFALEVTKSKCESAKGAVFEGIGCGKKCDGTDMALVATCTGASDPSVDKCCVYPLTDKDSKPITQAQAISKFADFVATNGADDLTDAQCQSKGDGSGKCVQTIKATDSSLCPQKVGTCTKSTTEGSRTCCTSLDPGTQQTPTTGGGTFSPLEKIPFLDETNPSFPSYVKAIYNFAIWSVAIAALLMIIVGAFFYLTSAGNTSQLGAAKTIIWDALIGLFVAFFAWMVLYQINPDLVTIDLSSLSALYTNSASGTSSSSVGASGTSSATSAQQGATPAGSSDTSACKALLTGSKSQCDLASSVLNGFISCIKSKTSGTSFTISSVTSQLVGNNLEKSKYCCSHGSNPKGGCPHGNGSCHHGCHTGQQGYSFAIDIPIRAGDSRFCTIANAAVACGAVEKGGPESKCGVSAWPGHSDHFHFSVGCD